jgi:phosphomannomutase
MNAAWTKKAQLWIEHEQNPQHKKIMQETLHDPILLEEYFGSRLEFGTAGLRGELGPGPNRMNATVVYQTSLAIAKYIKTFHDQPSVVIGYDARNKSDSFARLASHVFLHAGVKVHEFPYIVPTPLLAHAVVRLGASVGVMITASHNPPKDNGYKVYWSNGAQIIPPHDGGISKIFDSLPFPPRPVPTKEPKVVPENVSLEYMEAVQQLRIHKTNPLKIVYTPLHGVGGLWVQRTLSSAGYNDLHVVDEQFQPDGDFPFAPFPNPEEPQSMELAFALAHRIKADIIIANDPDADRLAVAIRIDDSYQKLTGDQVGLLLADNLLKNKTWDRPMVATTIVSSSQLKQLAAEYDAQYVETLTGFKWIANAAIVHDGDFVMGFEEALGYSVADVARDKDGVSAALLICDIASHAKSKGKTLRDGLFDIYTRHGFALSEQKSIKKPGAAGKQEIEEMMNQLRVHPPTHIAELAVQERCDIALSTRTDCTTGITTTLPLPKSNVLSFYLEDGSRIVVRPSGTEPKIKFYFETKSPIHNVEDWEQTEEQNRERIRKLADSLLKK